jgi:hypothetical protein
MWWVSVRMKCDRCVIQIEGSPHFVVYYSFILTWKNLFWLTKYRRNRINFFFFLMPPMIMLRVQWVDFDERFGHEDFVLFQFYLLPSFFSSSFCLRDTSGVFIQEFYRFFLTPHSFIVTLFTPRSSRLIPGRLINWVTFSTQHIQWKHNHDRFGSRQLVYWSRVVGKPEELIINWNDKSTLHVYTGYVHYKSIKWELKTRPIYECQYDERLKTKAEQSARLAYTGLLREK